MTGEHDDETPDGTSDGETPDGETPDTTADGETPDETSDETSVENPEPTGGEGSAGRTVSILGVDVVIEESFVTFPWRAGIKRAPVAFLATFALVSFFALLGGFGQGPIADRIALLGLFTYNFHNIHAAAGSIPQLFTPIVRPLSDVPVLWRLVRGLFTAGPQHGNPMHAVDILAGEVGTIGHTNLAARSAGQIPLPIYYAIPPIVLTATGYEYALRYWEETITDSLLEVVRFGLALAAGYVVTLLLGTIVFTVVMGSALAGQVFVVLPDRYMTVIFGFGYPAVFGTLGAALVYFQRGPEEAKSASDASGE